MNELMDADLDLKEAFGYLRAARTKINFLYQGSGGQWAEAGQALANIDALIDATENALLPLSVDLAACYANYNAQEATNG